MALNFLAVINPSSVHMSCHYILFVSSFTVCLDFFNTQNYFFFLLCAVNRTGRSEAKVSLCSIYLPSVCIQ